MLDKFTSSGSVAVTEECFVAGGPHVPISIYRDTGAMQSLIRVGVMDLSESTATGQTVLEKGETTSSQYISGL